MTIVTCFVYIDFIHPFTPDSGFTPGTPVFAHFTSAGQRYAPHDVAVKNKNKF